MAKQLRFHPQTVDDLSYATAYYDEISKGLGRRFRDALRDRFQAIAERPGAFACIHNQRWAALVHGFPYVMLFEHSGDGATILGIFHAASDQSGWFSLSVCVPRSKALKVALRTARHHGEHHAHLASS